MLLIRIRISAGSLPKCRGFIALSLVSVRRFAEFRKNRRVTVCEILINLLKSCIPQW